MWMFKLLKDPLANNSAQRMLQCSPAGCHALCWLLRGSRDVGSWQAVHTSGQHWPHCSTQSQSFLLHGQSPYSLPWCTTNAFMSLNPCSGSTAGKYLTNLKAAGDTEPI